MQNLTAIKNHYFFSQPHQPFFVLAFSNALISMFLFLLIFKGVIASLAMEATPYHAYTMIYLLFTPAFIGFLFTTFPKFSGVEPISSQQYLPAFGLFLMGSLFVYVGVLFSESLLNLGMVLVFVGHLGAVQILWYIHQNATVTDKEDQQWILIAMAFGWVAHLLFIIGMWLPFAYSLSIQCAVYLYLFLLTFTIAQRMVPFFSHTPIQKHKERFKVIIGLLVVHIVLELIQPHSSFLVDFFIAYLMGRELYRWKLPFPNANPLIWVLHIALFWIPVAFFMGGASSIVSLSSGLDFLSLEIHALALGFLVTILIGFGTRVTIGHSGNAMKVDKWTVLLFYWTQVVVVMRLLTSMAVANGWEFFTFVDLSVTVWLVLFGLWASRFFGVLIFGKRSQEQTSNPPSQNPQ